MGEVSAIKPIKGIPYYVQIRETIREKIRSGEYSVGSYLPSEVNLSKSFGVSRMTLRHALEDLMQEGLLIRKWGEGTIVSSTKVVRDYTKLTSFHEDITSRGLKTKSKVVKKEIIPADADIAEQLMIEKGDEVFHCFRVRMVKSSDPIAIHELFIPVSLCPWIKSADLENESLYNLYETHQLEVTWGSQIVEARIATDKQAEMLNIKKGFPVLYSDRVSYTHTNVPIERVIAVSPGDRFSLNLVMKR